jgi:hypothetical protein
LGVVPLAEAEPDELEEPPSEDDEDEPLSLLVAETEAEEPLRESVR